jgi:hypothetical protein
VAFLLRKDNAGSNTVAGHITAAKAAFAQLPGHRTRRPPRHDGVGTR